MTTEVRDLAGRLRSERIPTDVIWLDIDFQDRNRPFTTNPKTFPDLKGLARDVGKQGIKLVTITDLHVAHAPNQGYAPYDSGIAGDHFLKNFDGSLYVAPVWPGPSVFPDFTRKASRDWWGSLYKPFVDDGIAGFWVDMNEPAIFDTPTKTMPLTTMHRIEGDGFTSRPAPHSEVHNVYGMQNSRATYEGLLKLRPNVRPFVMTRASFAGGQRFRSHMDRRQQLDLGSSEARRAADAQPWPVRLRLVGHGRRRIHRRRQPRPDDPLVPDRGLLARVPKSCRQHCAARRALGRRA